MRSSEFTLEARRNPQQNPKESVMDVLDELIPKAEQLPGIDLPNLFVSFTKIPKLGINPGSRYNTPLGIYSYNAKTVLNYVDFAAGDMRALPFAGNQPWANIFSVSGNIVDLQAIDESQPIQYYERLYSGLLQRDVAAWRVDEIRDYIATLSTNKVGEARVGSPGGILWYVTWALSNSARMKNTLNSSKPPVIWNKIFRLMGIDGFVDREGIIHPSEPYQAVFFNMKSITPIRQMANTYSRSSISKAQEQGAAAKLQLVALRKLISQATTPEEIIQIVYSTTNRMSNNLVTNRSVGALLNKIPLQLRYQVLQLDPTIIKYFNRKLPQDIQAILLSPYMHIVGEIDVNRVVNFDTMIRMLSDAFRTTVSGVNSEFGLGYTWRKTLVAVLSQYLNNIPPDKMYSAFMQYREIPPAIWAKAMLEVSMPMKPDLKAQLEKIKKYGGYIDL